MDMNRELDVLMERMVAEYVARNRAAKTLKAMLDETGVGFYPVVDHVTLRITMTGMPKSIASRATRHCSSTRPIRTIGGRPASSRAG
jgi:hypothetical protein